MTYHLGQNWIEFINDNFKSLQYGDGKWVAFLPESFKRSYKSKRDIYHYTDSIINNNSLLGGLFNPKKLDVIVVFTTSDRHDIFKTKTVLLENFPIKDEDLIWWSNQDSDKSWMPSSGIEWHVNEVIEMLERKAFQLNQGNKNKADRLDKQADKLITRMQKALIMDATKNRKSYVVNPVFKNLSYHIDPQRVFVLMPFSEEWSSETYDILKDVGDDLGLTVFRADDLFEPSIIIEDIWEMINKSGLLIADITVHNANVFYELGIAHTIGKQVLLIKQKGGERSPFDIGFWRYVEYEIKYKKAKEFKRILEKVLRKYMVDNNIKI